MRTTLIGGIAILIIGLSGLGVTGADVLRFLNGAQPVRGRVVTANYGGRSHTSSVTVEIAAPSPFAGTHYPRVGLLAPAAGSELALLAKADPGTRQADVRPAAWWELWQAALLWLGCAVIGLVTLLEGRRRADAPDSRAASGTPSGQ
jgi:hypothetical protein